MTPDERSTMPDTATLAARLADYRAELARARTDKPHPLDTHSHAAYLGALARAVARTAAELAEAEAR